MVGHLLCRPWRDVDPRSIHSPFSKRLHKAAVSTACIESASGIESGDDSVCQTVEVALPVGMTIMVGLAAAMVWMKLPVIEFTKQLADALPGRCAWP